MANSSKAGLPRKPRPDFPLFPHQTGRWAKKVRGKLSYFGKVANDPKGEAALLLWLDQKDDLLAGRVPRAKGDYLTVAGLCNRFLEHKEAQQDCGELAPRTFDRYKSSTDLLVATFGKNRPVDDLRPEDFQAMRATMAKRWGAIALANEIQMIRCAFKFGYEAGLYEKPIRFGPGFAKPSAKALRHARTAGGARMFDAAQVQLLLTNASPNMGAMILLAINGGLGNTDLGMLTPVAFDLDGGWLNYPRQKTAIDRRIPLWPETVAAVRKVMQERREPVDPADKELLFIGPRGESYVGNHKGYRVTQEFDRVTAKAKIGGRCFYDLRRTFQTIAEGSHDLTAVQAIMGHAPASGDMSSIYRQRIDDGRLRAAVDFVRVWLYPPAPAKPKAVRKPRAK